MNPRARSAGVRAIDLATAVRTRFRGDGDVRDRLDRQASRIDALEREVQEAQRLQLRLAELTDAVQELLVPLAQRDQTVLDDVLKRYSAGL